MPTASYPSFSRASSVSTRPSRSDRARVPFDHFGVVLDTTTKLLELWKPRKHVGRNMVEYATFEPTRHNEDFDVRDADLLSPCEGALNLAFGIGSPSANRTSY